MQEQDAEPAPLNAEADEKCRAGRRRACASYAHRKCKTHTQDILVDKVLAEDQVEWAVLLIARVGEDFAGLSSLALGVDADDKVHCRRKSGAYVRRGFDCARDASVHFTSARVCTSHAGELSGGAMENFDTGSAHKSKP